MQVACTSDKPQLIWLQEKPKDPQFEPHARIKMAQVLGSPLYICSSPKGHLQETADSDAGIYM